MNTYVETTLPKWDDIFRLNKYFLSPFIFRGQQESNWGLQTSIERILKEYDIHTYSTDYSTEEKWMIHEFIKKFHLYSSQIIKQNDSFEWLAIMQHYGAPTRLLDFTESIFIASYFAAIESKTDSSIWAINRQKLRDNLHTYFKLPYDKGEALKDEVNMCHIEYANKHICRKFSREFQYPSTIITLEPVLFSERLSRQQGLFLMPTNPNLSFNDNLNSAFRKNTMDFESLSFDDLINISEKDGLYSNLEIIKIIIPKKLNIEIIEYLQQMNITAEILFPGLDGLAKSLIQTQMRK